MEDDFALKMGPGGNQYCCGKPVGCAMTHSRCTFLRHRWKLENIPGHRENLEAGRGGTELDWPDPAPIACPGCEYPGVEHHIHHENA